MRQYSQLGQDLFVLRTLGYMPGGYFIDSGASNGVDASNTLLLERYFGWRGICVEPNSSQFRELARNRKAHCVNCCLYDRPGRVEFVEAGPLGGVLQDYHPRLLAYATRVFGLKTDADGLPRTVPKSTRTMCQLLSEFAAPQTIDYWSLDTEGSELRILMSFPFDTHRVRVITIEHNGYPVRHDIRRFMERRGYALAWDFGIDDAYIDRRLISHGYRRSRHLRRRLHAP